MADRCAWAAALLAAALAASGLLLVLLLRYRAAPTVLIITKEVDDIFSFPNVMICPETNFSQSRVEEFISRMLPANVSAAQVRSGVRQLGAFTDPDVYFDTEVLEMLERVLALNNLRVEQATAYLMLSCEEFILKCRWEGEIVECHRLFHLVMTGDGFCCSFNGQSVNDFQSKKLQTRSSGPDSGLMMILSHKEELPTSVDLGYKWIVIQDADLFTNVKNNGSALMRGFEYLFAHRSKRMIMSEDTSSLDISLRRCVRPDENHLVYFPIYRRSYCMTECEMMASLRHCGCLKVTHPGGRADPLCRARDMRCARKYTAVAPCFCPSSCEHTESVISTNRLSLTQLEHVVDSFYDGLDLLTMSVVRVHVMNERTSEVKRQTYFTYFNLISQFGGVFSVYLGCSFISGVELLFVLWRCLRCAPSSGRADNGGKPPRRTLRGGGRARSPHGAVPRHRRGLRPGQKGAQDFTNK